LERSGATVWITSYLRVQHLRQNPDLYSSYYKKPARIIIGQDAPLRRAVQRAIADLVTEGIRAAAFELRI